MKKALTASDVYQDLGLPFAGIRLDHTVPEPFWRQLYAQIIALIGSGAVPEGKSLPTERDLAQALGVSRATVKRCYDVLRGAQILGGKGRAGSVVQAINRVEPSLGKLKGFTQEMRELGLTPSTELIERSIACDRMIASMFGRPSTAEFLRLVRVRKGDGLAMTREVAWYDLTIAPSLAQWDAMGSAYGYIKTVCGVPLDWAEQSVEAVLSSAQESNTFGFEQPAPCLLFKRKTYTAEQQLVEYVEGTFRGDAYVYKLKLEA
jgi:GntR family transcriptional regulator